jgi:hypothetical protein
LPIVATLYREKFTSFLQNWQEFFPQLEWALPIQMLGQTQGIFGEAFECSISEALLGTFYTIPDIACVLETQHPGRSMAFFNGTIKNILAQMFPSMAQQALVKMSSEPYQNTRIAMIHIMFQEILSYAVAKSDGTHTQNTYTLLATNGKGLKAQIDSLQAHPGKQPYVLVPQQNGSAFVFLLKNDRLSELIQKISQTNTFLLVYPRHTYRQLYQNLPFLIQLLKPLPPVLIEGGTKGTGLYLELRFRGKKTPRDESRG